MAGYESHSGYEPHSAADYANTVRCAVQEIQDMGAESPLMPFEDIFTLLESIREGEAL